MELIAICIAVITGYILGRKVSPESVLRCGQSGLCGCGQAAVEDADRALDIESPERASPISQQQSIRRVRLTTDAADDERKRRLRLLEAAMECIPKKTYEQLVKRVDQQVTQAQFSGLRNEDAMECPWLQAIVGELWPEITNFVEVGVFEDIVEPLLRDLLGNGVSFTSKKLGSQVPQLGPLKSAVVRDSRGGGVELTVGLRYVSNCDIGLNLMGVPVGVSNLSIVGTALVYLRPLVGGPVFLGGMEIAFLEPPEVEVDFKGVGKVVEMGLHSKVVNLVVDLLGSLMVLPNRIAFPIDSEPGAVYAPLLMNPEPIGYLRVTIVKAEGLAAADMHLLSAASSDPYVMVTFSTEKKKTPYITADLNPVWLKDNIFDFAVHSYGQTLNFDVYDKDVASDDLLGHYRGRSVQRFLAEGCKEQTVELEMGQGTLTYTVQWLDALPEGMSVEEDGTRVQSQCPGNHDATTTRKTACANYKEELRLLVDGSESDVVSDAIVLGAWYGEAEEKNWTDVTDEVCKLQYSGKTVLADAELLGLEDKREGVLWVEYMIPEPPHVAVISVCTEYMEGLKECDATFKVKTTVSASSWDEPKVSESGWGAGVVDTLAPQILQKNIERIADADKKKSYTTIAEELHCDVETVSTLLDPDTGMLQRRTDKLDELNRRRMQLDDRQIAKMEWDAKEMQRKWLSSAETDIKARAASSEPHFDFAAHVPVPADWEEVLINVLDVNNESIGGLRFRSRANGGNLGLRRMRTDVRDGGSGSYEVLDKQGRPYETITDRVRSHIDSGNLGFKIPVDEELLAHKRTPARLHARVDILNLIPREPVSYDLAILVEVVSAKNLVPVGKTGGRPSPHVSVTYGAMEHGQFQTKAMSQTVEPQWNHTFHFPVEKQGDALDFECYGGKHFMGRCNFNPFTFIRKQARREAREREQKGWFVDPDAPPPRSAQGWVKLVPRLRNEGDWNLLRTTKGRTMSMGFGSIQVKVTLRGDISEYLEQLDISDLASSVASTTFSDEYEDAEEETTEWRDDKDVTQCQRCEAPFTAFRRRHHCRSCGEIFCSKCVDCKVEAGPLKGVRVCSKCFKKQAQRMSSDNHFTKLLGEELSTMYSSNFEIGGKRDVELKGLALGELYEYLDSIGIHGQKHKQEISGKIALYAIGDPPSGARYMKLKIVRGGELIIQDVFTSDPYVIVDYRGEQVQTRVIRNTLNPVWRDKNEWTFPLTAHDDALELLCMDWDSTSSHDFMGYAKIFPTREGLDPEKGCVTAGKRIHKIPLGCREDPKYDDESIRKKKGKKKGAFPLGWLEVEITVEYGGADPSSLARPESPKQSMSMYGLDKTWKSRNSPGLENSPTRESRLYDEMPPTPGSQELDIVEDDVVRPPPVDVDRSPVMSTSRSMCAHSQWEEDRMRNSCPGCKQNFGMFRRRHHCRVCGKIYCNDCTPFRVPLEDHAGQVRYERACYECEAPGKRA